MMGDSYLTSPLKEFVDDYNCIRSSKDNDLVEPMGLCSLGVVELDTSIIPNVFGLRAFDPRESISRTRSVCWCRMPQLLH